MKWRGISLMFGILLAALLLAGAPAQAQGSKPARIPVFITQVIHRSQPVTRTNVLYLPAKAAAVVSTKPSKPGGGGGGNHGHGGSGACPTTSTSTYSVGCPVAPTTSMPEAEEHIAADPSDATGQTLVSAISDFSLRGGYNTSKWAISTDGGTTWSQNFVPINSLNQPITSDSRAWDANSDPVVAIDRHGNAYLASLYIMADYSSEGFYVNVGTVSGLTSGNFTSANPVLTDLDVDPNNFSLEDKPWIAVDNSGGPADGTVYATWSHFTGCQNVLGIIVLCGPDEIDFAYSTDQGATWSTPVTLSTPEQFGNVQGSQVAVGPDGTVYVAYEVFDPNSNTRWQYLTSAPATSSSFTAPVQITPGFLEVLYSANYRTNSFPSLAVGPTGNVFLEYADQPLSNAQIEFISCTSGCSSSTPVFSSPLAINATNTGQEVFPAISVDANNMVHTSWFDTRNSPTNTSAFDVYATFNSGAGFAPLARVTPTTVNSGTASFIGDYSGIVAFKAATSTFAHPVWNTFSETCGRATCRYSGTLQTATLTLP
jgi:hypothetical protein